jgi:hypothetical protein
MPEASPSDPPGDGHRERLRARFLAGADASQTDASLLELLLTYAIPRQDVAPLAHRLLDKFGSLAAVLAANPAELKACPGIKENSLVLLKLAGQLRGLPDAPASVSVPAITATETLPPEPVRVRRSPPPRSAVASPDGDVSGTPEAVGDCEISAQLADSILEPAWSGERKLQVSNGYSLDPAQLARFLKAVAAKPEMKKIPRKMLMEETGLSYGQTEGLASISAALGLVVPLNQVLTAFGRLVATHDLFLDSLVTLQYGHFLAAGNPRNLVWHAVFDDLLINQAPMLQTGWCAWFREKLAGQYSDGSLVKHLAQEVRFVVDAYCMRNLSKLGLLAEMPDQTLALRRSCALLPPVLAAMIYAIGERAKTSLVPFSYLHGSSGSPGRLFSQDTGSLRQAVEALHQREWLRFEVRHGLDQVRLIDGYSSLEFLASAYENRAPQPLYAPPNAPAEQLLL